MSASRADWLSFDGKIDRVHYFISGTFLVALKFFVDSWIALMHQQQWKAWNYFIPPTDASIFTLSGPLRSFYLALWIASIPFFWIGITLTIQRLRDAGYRALWCLLFFVPTINLIFFLLLSVAPTATPPQQIEAAAEDAQTLSRPVPIGGIMLAVLVGFGLVLLSTNYLGTYGWGLFLGVPFVLGFITSWFFNYRTLHSRTATSAVCILTCLALGLTLIGYRAEGLVCLVMALPLALPFAIAGGLAAHHSLSGTNLTPSHVTSSVALLPLLLFAEHVANFTPAVRPVVTSVTIAAPASVVWRNVIAFPPLAPPTELIFHTGIAYPIGATISGSGVEAVRRCRFSTGDFVEPITTWDENHLLAFNVTEQPPAMHELGFGEIHTPHIDRNYMRSQHGQFRLVAIDAKHTLPKAPRGIRTTSGRKSTGADGLMPSSTASTPASSNTSRQSQRAHQANPSRKPYHSLTHIPCSCSLPSSIHHRRLISLLGHMIHRQKQRENRAVAHLLGRTPHFQRATVPLDDVLRNPEA